MNTPDIRKTAVFVLDENAKNNDADYVEIPAVFEKIIEQYGLRKFPEDHYVFSYDDKPREDLLGPNTYIDAMLKCYLKLAYRGQATTYIVRSIPVRSPFGKLLKILI